MDNSKLCEGEPAALCTESSLQLIGEKMDVVDLDDAEHFQTALGRSNPSALRPSALRPLSRGDTFILGSLAFKVTGTLGECCVVSPEILCQGEPVRGDELAYDEVDGLRKQMAQIHEVVELPLRYSELFTSIGVKAPKAIMLPGPSGRAVIVRDFQNAGGTSNLFALRETVLYTYGMISPFVRELGGEGGGESSIIASGNGGGYEKINSDDGNEQITANGSGGRGNEISSDNGSGEHSADEESVDKEDVPEPPTSTRWSWRSAWGRAARWVIGVTIPLIVGTTTLMTMAEKDISFDVFNLFTNALAFLLLLLASIILRKPFPTVTPSLFVRIVGLHIFEPLLAETSLSFGSHFLPAQFVSCLPVAIPTFTYVMSLIFRIESISIRKKSSQAKLGGLTITIGGACLITVYNGPIIEAHQAQNYNWTWPVGLLIASVLFSACHNVLLETTLDKYNIEALWLAAIIRFSGVIASLIFSLVTTNGREYKWIFGFDFVTFCCVFSGIAAGVVQYLGTSLTKKTDAVFASSFSPISMIFVIVLSTMIFHDRIKISSVGGVIMIVIGLCIFHWGKYRSTSEEEACGEKEHMSKMLELWRRFKMIRRSLMYGQEEEHYV